MLKASKWVKLKFSGPFLIVFLIFFLFPLSLSFYLSFTEYSLTQGGITEATFIGLENYKKALTDERFITAIKNTFIIILFAVPLQVIIAFTLALLAEAMHGFFKKVINVGYYLPTVASTVAVTIMFMYLFKVDGLINNLLFFVPNDFVWLESTQFSKVPIILMHSWNQLGLYMIIFIGGLKSIPNEVYEAAKIDGASKFKEIKDVTIPQLKPVFFFVFITATITGLKLYDEVAIMTENTGGPADSTLTVVLYIYNTAFKNFDIGYASAMSIIFLLIILILIGLERLVRRRVKN